MMGFLMLAVLAGWSGTANAQTASSAGPEECDVCNNWFIDGDIGHKFELLWGGQFADSYCNGGPFYDGLGCHFSTVVVDVSCSEAHYRCDWMEEAALLAQGERTTRQR